MFPFERVSTIFEGMIEIKVFIKEALPPESICSLIPDRDEVVSGDMAEETYFPGSIRFTKKRPIRIARAAVPR